ncbi:MAG: C69 family dipeptidase [Mobilicoccus sp.]|nr:C69 family dipeptidase [Mobilicoccus sp.]
MPVCDTFVSRTDGGLVFAKNSDRDPGEPQAVRFHPAATHAPGAQVEVTWTSIPQADRTRAVLLSQPWWMWGAEMGANDAGVVIGNEAVFTRGARRRGEEPGVLLGMDLVRLALERSGSASEAVQVLITLLEAHGQGGSCSRHHRFTYDNSFLVTDAREAFIVETAGRHHAVAPVQGAGASISNALTIGEFARHFADPIRGRVAQAAARRRRTTGAAHAVARRSGGDAVAAAVAALRDHGGAPAPQYSPINGALSGPCAHAGGLLTSTQTTASWVSDLRGQPWHIVTGTAAPCLSVFHPVPFGPDAEVEPSTLTDRDDPTSTWWRHERLHRAAARDHTVALARIGEERDALERDLLSGVVEVGEARRRIEAARARWIADIEDARLVDRRPRSARRVWRTEAARAGRAA